MYTIDDSLPFILNIFLSQFVGLIGTLIITCYGLHLMAVLFLPLGVCYYFIQVIYFCFSANFTFYLYNYATDNKLYSKHKLNLLQRN